MTRIYFKLRGKMCVYDVDGQVSHGHAVHLVREARMKPDGAVMLVYS